MTTIIGQEKLLSIIDSYYAKRTLPKTLMFIGPSGCGKHTITKYVAEKFELDLVEIDENVTAEDLENYLFSTLDTMYLINLNKFSEKQQNQFLKFIEEPTKSVFITLIANSEVGVLNTVLNRCTKHYLDFYTKEQIVQITNTAVNDLAFSIFKTPGKLLNLTDASFQAILDLADKVVHKISIAPYPNALVVSTRVNYKDLYNKIDFDLFMDVVEYLALDDYKNTGAKQSLTVFNTTNRFKQYATQANLIKEMLMINYLTTLWEAVQNDTN
jgi:DNA polymerase III delta prime subunit